MSPRLLPFNVFRSKAQLTVNVIHHRTRASPPKPANRGDQAGLPSGGIQVINANQHASIKAPSPTSREHVAQPTAVWLRARCRSRFCNVS